MSHIGQSPKVKRTRYIPQSADPVSPQEGDFFYSDGTPRAEGLWVYKNGAWEAIVGERLTALEFAYKPVYEVRMASTANITNPLTAIFNGSTAIDGITPATGDVVLLKNQTTSSDNGLYLVGATSGTTVRATIGDSAEKLTYFCASVLAGTTQQNTLWFQHNVLTDLSDAQNWTDSPTAFTWTVPADTYEIIVQGCGAGGGGGSGNYVASSGGSSSGAGGGAGAGAPIRTYTLSVTPGETISVTVGKGGLGGRAGTNPGDDGENGTSTIVTTLLNTVEFPGAQGGTNSVNTTPGVGGTTVIFNSSNLFAEAGADGAAGTATVGQDSQFATGGAGGIVQVLGGTHGGGGGGGAALTDGGSGGNGTTLYPYTWPRTTASGAGENGVYGAGGGGGGGGGHNTPGGGVRYGGPGGHGGNGYIKITY